MYEQSGRGVIQSRSNRTAKRRPIGPAVGFLGINSQTVPEIEHVIGFVSEFRSSSMYPLLERISPRTRKIELFARMHNTHAGWRWMSLDNHLNGVRLVDDGLRARFKAAYPEVEVQPQSPPRPSALEVESREPFA